MITHPPFSRCLVTGANARVAWFLRAAWRHDHGVAPIWCARRPPADIVWSPEDDVPDLPRCGTVLALWGKTSGDASTLAQNSVLVHDALRLAKACGAGRVIHLSSTAVYGPGTRMAETRMPAPVNAYGAAKLEMERTIADLPRPGPHHVILRVANVVGADSLAASLRDPTRPVTLDRFGDGTGPCRSYVAPGDLARVFAALMCLPEDHLPGVMNVATSQPVAMADLARAAGRSVVWRAAPTGAQPCVSVETARVERTLPGAIRCCTPAQMIADWHRLEPPG
ncbi:NAD-dependent epimerase/dehydratase family protein [Roseovarius sp. D22-M7]|uniref:NAD-dependent epimerase/dehydratase family protein n=1 Tax=Roseovarius sp. D22-M7 TaxID=3127116 RepID=UPI00300F8523